MRPPFTDGINSAAHVALGFAFGPWALIPFVIYQMAQGTPNDFIDCLEYGAGWLARVTSDKNAFNGTVLHH